MLLSYETHLDPVDRRNCEYAGSCFKGEDGKFLTQEQYIYARNRILDALVRKAIDVFSSGGDGRLFFTSLKNYL